MQIISLKISNYVTVLSKSGSVFILFILFSKRACGSFSIKYVNAKVEFGFLSVKVTEFS